MEGQRKNELSMINENKNSVEVGSFPKSMSCPVNDRYVSKKITTHVKTSWGLPIQIVAQLS